MTYRLSALEPPQIWEASAAQGVSHPDATGPALFWIPVPQKHWVPNSMPAYVKPAWAQVAWHACTVFPDTRMDVLSVRWLVSSE